MHVVYEIDQPVILIIGIFIIIEYAEAVRCRPDIRSPQFLSVHGDIGISVGKIVSSRQGTISADRRMRSAYAYQRLHKFKQFFGECSVRPFDITGSIILVIRIIVTELGITELVTAVDQRGSLRHYSQGKSVLELAFSEFQYVLFAGNSFISAVPAVVIIRTVYTVLSVVKIVLLVI